MNILAVTEHAADLQLRREIAQRCREQLERGAGARRQARSKEQWERVRAPLLDKVREAFPAFLYNREPIAARVVSRHDFGQYRVENVLFESYPGWEVNATVYLPAAPGRYPGVVCPTGHSCKTGESYQIPAQVFARNGYIAVSFDPPGVAGELQEMNNHFTNGLIGYLTGIWSNTHFVLDAIRCVDYLESRDDVDLSHGVAMTGVSGGGATTIYASLIDERISFLAPVCCLNEHEAIHLTDWYTSCPEQFAPGLIADGIDFTDLVALQAPKPCLIVGGREDDLFDYRNTQRLYHDAADVYALYGKEQELGLYLQQCGHAYTAEMAVEVVRWMHRVFKPSDEPVLVLGREDMAVQAPELLHCHPANAANMYTINKAEGRRLQQARHVPVGEPGAALLQSKLQQLLGLEPPGPQPDGGIAGCVVKVEPQKPVGVRQFDHVTLKLESASIPGLVCRRDPARDSRAGGKHAAILMIDEAGKWAGFRQFGSLTKLEDTIAYSIDVSGIGELQSRPALHDVAPWCDIDRIQSYLSFSSNRPVMGLRVRDALYAWHYLRTRPEVDPDRLILAGRGLGATVALLAAQFIGPFHKLVLWDSLLNYQALTEDFPFNWPQSIIVPHLLQHCDLQDLLRHAPCGAKAVINPLDAQRRAVRLELAHALYPAEVEVHTGLGVQQAEQAFVRHVLGRSKQS